MTKQDRNIDVLFIINDEYAILGELANPVWQRGGKERTIFFGCSPRAFEMRMLSCVGGRVSAKVSTIAGIRSFSKHASTC